MALTPIVLNDLTWDQLVDVARGRIATASAGQWTLHAPVDPGVTLLELFAGQFEDLLYRLDQPCEARQHAILRLLGHDRRSIGIASTVLALDDATAVKEKPPADWIYVPAGTLIRCDIPVELARSRAMRAINADRGPWLTTSRPLTALRLSPSESSSVSNAYSGPVTLTVGNRDRTKELLEGRLPELVSEFSKPSETTIVLRLSGDISLPVEMSSDPGRRTISLFLDLHVPTDVEPEWSENRIEGIDGPSLIKWCYRSHDGKLMSFDKGTEDGTQSLRRSGIVRLVLPKEWRGTTDKRLEIVMRVEDPQFVYLPRVKQIIPNAVIARQEQEFTMKFCESNNSALTSIRLRRPSSTLDVSQIDHATFPGEFLIIPHSARLTEHKNEAEVWHAVEDFSRSTSADRHFVVDRELSQLRFGDGFHGRLPGADFFPCTLTFTVGGGSKGNLDVASFWRSIERHRTLTFINVVPVTGGSEAETMPRALARVTTEARRATRCVLKEDFETLARETPGASVSRAYAMIGHDPRFPNALIPGTVTVYIVPDLPPSIDIQTPSTTAEITNKLVPSRGDVERVKEYLDRSRLICEEVFVLPPAYEDITVSIEIEGRPSDPAAVRARIAEDLQRHFHPIHGASGDGWAFGDPIRPSAIMGRLQKIVGDDLRVVSATVGNARTRLSSKIEDIAIRPESLPFFSRLDLRFLASRPDKGGLA